MNEYPTNYRVLRDQRHWDEAASLAGLVARADGALLLQGLPGLAAGEVIQLPAPYDVSISGVACGKGRTTYTAITEADGQTLISECGCADYVAITGPSDGGPNDTFKFPRGLLVVGDQLLVADSGNAKLLVLELPSLRKCGEWTSGLKTPACLAADSTGRVYVLDIGNNIVLRFNLAGEADTPFNAAMANLTNPAGLAIDAQDRLYVYVADAVADTILRFDTDGTARSELILPASPFKPSALAARGTRLYVADAKSGFIWAYDTLTQVWLGKVQAYRGSVAALAIDDSGVLLVKPGDDDTLYRLEADTARVEAGTLLAGPLDAGEGDVWERVWVEAEMSAETSVLLEVAASNISSTAIGGLVWKLSPSLDVLLRTLVNDDGARFIWLRVTLKSHDGRTAPQLLQVQASTPHPSYLEHLPAIYRRDDAATGFLERWLALFRSELGDWDRALAELPGQYDARTVSEPDIGRLAAWIALDLPARMDAPEQRRLLTDAQMLYRKRGTPAGLREMVWRRLGITIHIFEAFRERRIWQLGEGQSLGLDTALAAGTPAGITVPGYTYADRALSGLRGDYYQGNTFEILRRTGIDNLVKFPRDDNGQNIRLDITDYLPPSATTRGCSFRWSGQVQPRFAETFTFRTQSNGKVRLWIGRRLIIDTWTEAPPSEDAGQIMLEAGRWYPIVLELSREKTSAEISLFWSSASQYREIVPQECLYSVLDETAAFAPEEHGGYELLEVGRAVVGEGRPLDASDYGAPLSDDYAHLFTVMVSASQVPLASQRQALRDLIEAEKPAHTDFRLCLVDPRMRVGVQARVGIDSIVAGPGPAMRLGGSKLGRESYLGGARTPEREGHVK